MTKHVKQKAENGCGVAALAMLMGEEYGTIKDMLGGREKVTMEEIGFFLHQYGVPNVMLHSLVLMADYGLDDAESILLPGGDRLRKVVEMVEAPAIVAVDNWTTTQFSYHAVYFDGKEIWDPASTPTPKSLSDYIVSVAIINVTNPIRSILAFKGGTEWLMPG